MPINHTHHSRLRWACRRGMLELDLILNRFLSQGYDALSPSDQKLFLELLEREDTELFAWFFESSVEVPDRFVELVRRMR